MTDDQFFSAWQRLNGKPDRVRARYHRFVQWLMRNAPLPF
jgi:hypothetical protein